MCHINFDISPKCEKVIRSSINATSNLFVGLIRKGNNFNSQINLETYLHVIRKNKTSYLLIFYGAWY